MGVDSFLYRSASRLLPAASKYVPKTQLHATTTRCSSSLFFSKNIVPAYYNQYYYSPLRCYSSPRPASDEALLRVLQAEIEDVTESNNEVEEETPEGFPLKITLRKLQLLCLEKVVKKVEFHENENDRLSICSVDFVVRVAKGVGPIMELECAVDSDEILVIRSLVRDDDWESKAQNGDDWELGPGT